MIKAAKARALLHGRHHATTEDIISVARPILRHRIVLTFNAETDGVDVEDVLDLLLASASAQPSRNGKVVKR